MPLRAELAVKFPPELMALTHLPGLGPKRVRQLVAELGIHNRDDLMGAAQAGALRTIRGFGPKMEERILAGLGRQSGDG